LAKAAGVSMAMISKIENAGGGSVETMAAIAHCLGVMVDDLI